MNPNTLPSLSLTEATRRVAVLLDLADPLTAAVQQQLDAGVEVVHVPEGDRPGHALLVTVGVEADVLPVDRVGDVVRLVLIRFGAGERAEDLLGGGQVRNRVDDRLDSC